MAINLNSSAMREASQNMADVLRSDAATDEEVTQAWERLGSAIADDVREQFVSADGDRNILAQRGFRVPTRAEEQYLDKFASTLADSRSSQEFETGMAGAIMPATIIDEMMTGVERNHPLLAALNLRGSGLATKIFVPTGAAQRAAWGALNSTVTQEITQSFKEIDATQKKLSAYAVISRDELQFGPTYLLGLISAVLGESYANGLEYGFVQGNGLNEPVGLIRDVHVGVSVNSSTGYPAKTAQAITEISPAVYGGLVAQLAVDEDSHEKNVNVLNGAVSLLVNTTDYLTKIMPATTVQTLNGNYVSDIFPVATNVITSAYVPSNKAVLALLDEYYCLFGGSRGLETSDEYKFLEDQRYFKMVAYADGRAKDNTSALLLDITNLAPVGLKIDSIDKVVKTKEQE